jgi:hypothetical protein
VTQSWRLDGLLRTKSWPSSDTATLASDPAKRPIALSFGSAGSLSPGLRRDGNVTSEGRTLTGVSGHAGAGTQSFTYDALNRVTVNCPGLRGGSAAWTSSRGPKATESAAAEG